MLGLLSYRNASSKQLTPLIKHFKLFFPPPLLFLAFFPSALEFSLDYDIWLILRANTIFSGFPNLKTRWPLHWPQGRGKTTYYQQFHLAFYFLVFKYTIPLLPIVRTPWRQREWPIKQPPSTSPPLRTTPHFLPSSPLLPMPTGHQKQNKYHSKLPSLLCWNYCCKTCSNKQSVNQRENKCIRYFLYYISSAPQEFIFRQIHVFESASGLNFHNSKGTVQPV